MSDRSPEARENARTSQRARQRARWRTAMHYKTEYRSWCKKLDDGIATRKTTAARAMQAVLKAHPKTFQNYLREELDIEGFVPMKRGGRIQHPCGTRVAWRRHSLRGEVPCELCQGWFDTRFGTAKCKICQVKFIRPAFNSDFCSKDCRWLWKGYFEYHVNWVESRVFHARSVLRRQDRVPFSAVLDARRVLKEYKETGTVTLRRPTVGSPFKALTMAHKVGIDLDKTLKRLQKEAA